MTKEQLIGCAILNISEFEERDMVVALILNGNITTETEILGWTPR